MIYLYESAETDFRYNGKPLPASYDVTVSNTLNSEYYVMGKYPLDKDKVYKEIVEDRIIKVHTMDGMEPFRIVNVSKHELYVEFEAWPLFYADMRSKLVKPLNLTGVSGQAALNAFKNNLLIDTPFDFYSDITDNHDYHTQNKNERENNPKQLYNALDVFKTIVSRWGGELWIRGYDIRVNERIGTDTEAMLYEKKNITEFVDTTNIEGIVTRLHGKSEWQDEPQEGEEEGQKHSIETTVNSPLINNYSGVVFEKQYTNNDIRTEQALKKWLNLKFTTENIDKPKRTIEVGTNVIDGTKIGFADTLILKYIKHDTDVRIKVVGYEYDGFANELKHVVLGQPKNTSSSTIGNTITDLVNNVVEPVDRKITIAMNSADGKSTVFHGTADPNTLNLNAKENDTYFRTNGSEKEIWRFTGTLWELIMDTSETTKNADAIAEQQKEIDVAKEVADEALSEIDVAIRNAGFTSLDDTIKSVQSQANTAFDTANDLIGEVSGYSQTVDGFNQTVNNYTNQVANFQSDVNGFSSTVASYSADVEGYTTQVSSLTNTVDGFNSTVTNIDGRVSTLSNTVDGLSSTISGHNGRISTVEQTASGLQATVADKANKTQVTQLSDAYNIFVGGIEDRKNLLPGMESGGVYGNTGNEYDTTSRIRSPYIPIKQTGGYIVSLDGNPISHNLYKYTDIGEFHSSTGYSSQSKFVDASEIKYIRILIETSNPDLKYQLERSVAPTDYVPFIGDVSSTQISVLEDNINLRVSKGDVINQINISDENILIQSDRILLDGDVTVSGTAWMDGAVIKDASIDTAQIADLAVSSAKIAELDVGKITGDTAIFVRANFNSSNSALALSASGITSSGAIYSYKLDGTGVEYIANGVRTGVIRSYSGTNYSGRDRGISLIARTGYELHLGYGQGATIGGTYTPAIAIDGTSGNIHMNNIHPSVTSSQGVNFTNGAVGGRQGVFIRNNNSYGTGFLLANNGDIWYRTSDGTWSNLSTLESRLSGG